MLLTVMRALEETTDTEDTFKELDDLSKHTGAAARNGPPASHRCSLGLESNIRNYKRVPKLVILVAIQIMAIDQLVRLNGRQLVASPFGLPDARLDPLVWAASNHTSYIIDQDSINSTSVPSLPSNKLAGASKANGTGAGSARPAPPDEDDYGAPEDQPLGADEEEEDDADNSAGADDEDDDEDDDEFYTVNPVDSSEGVEKKFDDFDDFDALGLGGFYGAKEQSSKPTTGPLAGGAGPAELAHSKPNEANKFQDHSKGAAGRRPGRRRRRRRRQRRPGDGPKDGPKKHEKTKTKRKRKKNKAKVSSEQGRAANGTNRSVDAPRTVAASFERERQASPSSSPETSASSSNSNNCAMLSAASGTCVDYQSVEQAVAQARRLIAFRRPGGLNSLEPSESTVHSIGELTEWTSRLIAMRFGLSSDEVAHSMGQIDVSQTSLWRLCPRLFRSPWARQCYTYQPATASAAAVQPLYYQLDPNQVALSSGRYRSLTGQCNNPLVPNLGSSLMDFVRLNEPDYGDGVGSSRRPQSGVGELPPARLVSLALHSGTPDLPSDDLAAMFAAWGQLINHDLAFASGARPATGHESSCCSADARFSQVSSRLGRVCMPIRVGADDPVYGRYGVRCHDFKRSIAGLRPGCSLGPRTQLNLVSSFVDGSFVYGSSRSLGRSLRSNSANGRGQLAVWNYFDRTAAAIGPDGQPVPRKPLLPPQLREPDDECLGRREGLYCFRSGDLRTNQQVPLVVLHTIHTRQHNRLAEALEQINPHWSSERIYQEARHIHIAQIQHILMREYLPLLLGDKTRTKFDLTEPADGQYWDHYEPNLNPGIAQEFAAAAFRQGHSTVASEVYRVDVLSRMPRRLYRLRELFRQPWPVFEPGAIDEFLLGLTETASREMDPFVSQELSGHLLEEPSEPVGLDLVAINIQRGELRGEWRQLDRTRERSTDSRAFSRFFTDNNQQISKLVPLSSVCPRTGPQQHPNNRTRPRGGRLQLDARLVRPRQAGDHR
jgi:hypothetical protein